jgi:hypothetical protein
MYRGQESIVIYLNVRWTNKKEAHKPFSKGFELNADDDIEARFHTV